MADLLTTASSLQCPHGGTVNAISANTRVQADGSYVLRSTDTFLVVGCSFTLGVVYHPCVTVQWVQFEQQVKAQSDFTLSENSVGLCQAADQAAQGTVQIVSTQSKASAGG